MGNGETPRDVARSTRGIPGVLFYSRFPSLEACMRSRYAQATPFLRLVAVAAAAGCAAQPNPPGIAGDWDGYFANGVTARPGFDGWRRMGFAHFAATSSGVTGVVRRRRR